MAPDGRRDRRMWKQAFHLSPLRRDGFKGPSPRAFCIHPAGAGPVRMMVDWLCRAYAGVGGYEAPFVVDAVSGGHVVQQGVHSLAAQLVEFTGRETGGQIFQLLKSFVDAIQLLGLFLLMMGVQRIVPTRR